MCVGNDPGCVINMGPFTPEQLEEIRKAWEERHQRIPGFRADVLIIESGNGLMWGSGASAPDAPGAPC